MLTERTTLRIREYQFGDDLAPKYYVCTDEPHANHWLHLYSSPNRKMAEEYASAIAANFPERYELEVA